VNPGSGATATRVFKTRVFDRWAIREGLDDDVLLAAAIEIGSGLIDARLGGQILKKRIALPGRGKRGGGRTLVAFQQGHGCFFIYGFAKNERENIDGRTLATLRAMARRFLDLSVVDLVKSLQAGELIEIEE
jgi:hypothetical protein